MRVLLIPGFGASQRDFQNYKEVFDNFEVVDLQRCITLDDHLSRIDAQVVSKKGSVNIIGVSWGGILAMIYAERFPKSVDRLVITGTDRKLRLPQSLTMIMKFPFPIFCLMVFLYILVFPVVRIIDPKEYRQKYGGIGILRRNGWKNTHQAYRKSLLVTEFRGTLFCPTLLLNLSSDFLISKEIIDDLKSTGQKVIVKYVAPLEESQIHMSHELDSLIIREANLTFPLL